MITAMRKLASESEAELEEMHQLVHKERWEHHRAACDQFMEHFPDLSAEESSNGQMPLHQKIRNAYMRSNCHSPRSRAPAPPSYQLRTQLSPHLRCRSYLACCRLGS
jgi:hypothetical protein